MRAAARARSVLLVALAAAVLRLFGGTYSYNGMSWTDSVSPGQWTSKYGDAKAYAKNHNAPLVVVWANPGCGYCKTFESSVGGNSQVRAWAAKRSYMMVFALGTATKSEWGITASDGSAAFSFAGSGLTQYPFVGVWWPRKSGGEVKAHFSGRSGKMPVKSGSIAQQFMDSIDYYVGAYASVAPKALTVTFDANGGAFRQSGDKTRIVMAGKTVGTLPELKDRSGYRMSGWFTEKSGGTAVSSSTKVTGNVTYYAQWKKTVTLTLSASPLGAGTLSGGGAYDEEKSVTLKATPRNGYVFSCWKKGSAVVSQSAKFPYTLGTANVALTAVFITKQQDLESVALVVDNVAQATSVVHEVALVQGVNVNWPVLASALTAATPSVSGLPSGMKLVKEKAADAAYSISGAPTAVSKKDSKTGEAKPSAVTIKVKTAGGNTVSYKMSLVVEPRPDWAVGAFNGGVFDGASPVGLVGSLTVAANGKISGKLLRDGKTYALSAASFDAYEGRVFRATVIGKNGKELVTNAVAVASEAIVAPGGGETLRGVVNGESYSSSWCAWQNLWKSSDWKALAKKVAKAKKLDMPDGVALKFSSSGAVAAKFGGYSCSTVLIPSGDSDFCLFLYFPPKAGKFDGYNARTCVCWDGEEFSGQMSND